MDTAIHSIAIGWFCVCLTLTLTLSLTDHWLVYAVAWTPLPSLLLPVSLVLCATLLALKPRSARWVAGAALAALLLTPYEIPFSRIDDPIKGLAAEPVAGRTSSRTDTELRIVNANLGQRERTDFLEFIESTRPDIVATQAGSLQPDTPWLENENLERMEVGRFTLYSQWPIQDGKSLIESDHSHVARFEVAWPAATLAIYVIHLPTPRFMLANLRGPGIFRKDHRREADRFQKRKREILLELSQFVTAEKGPTLVLGDANQPAMGPAYRELLSGLQDGHRAAGWGFGYTIPGTVNSLLLQFLCPWARVDYILANQQLQFREHRLDPPHLGQHRALYARLRVSSPDGLTIDRNSHDIGARRPSPASSTPNSSNGAVNQ